MHMLPWSSVSCSKCKRKDFSPSPPWPLVWVYQPSKSLLGRLPPQSLRLPLTPHRSEARGWKTKAQEGGRGRIQFPPVYKEFNVDSFPWPNPTDALTQHESKWPRNSGRNIPLKQALKGIYLEKAIQYMKTEQNVSVSWIHKGCCLTSVEVSSAVSVCALTESRITFLDLAF